jgi:hypothetical protein
MRSSAEVEQVAALIAEGLNDCEIARVREYRGLRFEPGEPRHEKIEPPYRRR